MKKILALVLALCMIFALCACGSDAATSETRSKPAATDANTADDADDADDADEVDDAVAEYSVDDMNEDLYDGEWTSIGDAYYMYLPSDWEEADLSGVDADAAAQVVYAITDQTGVVDVEYYDADAQQEKFGTTYTSAEDLANAMSEAGNDAVVANVNGVDVVYLASEDNDAAFIYLPDEDGLFTITFAPISNEEYANYFNNMIDSIMTAEDFEASDAE